MLHIHFGAGRLGLGLVAPFFQRPGSELYLLNRAVSSSKATGETSLTSERRNELLETQPEKFYVVQELSADGLGRHRVHYNGFLAYDDDNVDGIIDTILEKSRQKHEGVIVTASVLKAENYRAVVKALNRIAETREGEQVGPVFLVACENTLSALDVLQDPGLSDVVSKQLQGRVACVHALVDRMCVGLEEDNENHVPTVLVRVEHYGSLKLEISPATELLLELLHKSRVEFSRHVAVEKQIKSWLLNGSHWLIALAAYQESEANQNLKLNQFLSAHPDRRQFAAPVMKEMREGVAAILHNDDQYAGFVDDVDVGQYLEGASDAILERFMTNEDPIVRILARFQAPSANSLTSLEAFSKRFSDRVDEPISAYEADKGIQPVAMMHSMHSLVQLIASGSFIDRASA